MRPTMVLVLLVLLAPSWAMAQAKKPKEGAVTNDDPARPLQMPPASTETKEALEDFERFQRRGAWERALKALYTVSDDQAVRFVDGEDGFIVPIEQKRRAILSALPPAGQSACRLFYDSDAKKLLEQADGPNELKNLERAFSAYFLTSVGDNAADRLGDLYYELGRFDRAADCWLAILRERPDSELAPALISFKAALALHRAGRKTEFNQLSEEIHGRYAEEMVTVAGRKETAAGLLDRTIADEQKSTAAIPKNAAAGARSATAQRPAAPAGPAPDLSKPVGPAWRFRFADSVEAGMTPPELLQWESNALSATVPAAALNGNRLAVNYLGHVFALDLETGKLLWRSASFHNLELMAMRQQGRLLDSGLFSVLADSDRVWCLARDMNDQNMLAPFQLICRRADNGELVWKSADLSDYANFQFNGPPLLAEGKLFVPAHTGANGRMGGGQQQQLVLAIQPHDGKLLWQAEIGLRRQGSNRYYYYGAPPEPLPRMAHRAGTIYVDSHEGVLARLDPDSGVIDWGYGYATEPFSTGSRFFFYPRQAPEPDSASGAPAWSDGALLVKGAQSGRLSAIDPNRMKRLWDRPISKGARLLGALGPIAYFGGAELSALDLHDRELLWATRVAGGSRDAKILLREDGLWQLTPRGIYEIDPKSGHVRQIFRGADLGAVGGDLFLTDRWLLAVSNRSITAYPRQAGGQPVATSAHSTNKQGKGIGPP